MAYERCCRPRNRLSSDTSGITMVISIPLICIIVCVCIRERRRYTLDRPVDLEFNNRSTILPLRTSTQPIPISTSSSITTWQNTDNHPLQPGRTQSPIRSTFLRNSTASLEQSSPPIYDNSSIRRDTTISFEQQDTSSPPSYDDWIQRNSTTVIMKQEPLTPPPTYDDSIQEN